MSFPSHLRTRFRLRSFGFTHFKSLVSWTADYKHWRAHRRENFEAQLAAYAKWRHQKKTAGTDRLLAGQQKASARQLLALRLRSWMYRNLKSVFERTPGYQKWQRFRREPEAVQIAMHIRRENTFAKQLASPLLSGTAEEASRIAVKTSDNPVVSVLIPAHNKIAHTLSCLRSIQQHAPLAEFEIIVIDDCSSDNTPELLNLVKGLRVIRNTVNLGFVRSCNTGAREARGQYLLFLNNKTQVLAGWLDELIRVFQTHPNIGLVGSELLHPNGMLQSAGGIVWNDASLWNYGRDAYPDWPEFGYLRDVDYCSGASIMVPADLFRTLGGFDERYVLAFYQDADLAFSIREAGRRVVFQPFSRIIHHDGASSGPDIATDFNACRKYNQAKFLDKWRDILAAHDSTQQRAAYAPKRAVSRRALIVDLAYPTPDQDSGSVDAVYSIKVLQALGFKVTFLPENLQYLDRYTEALQRMGVECQYSPYIYSLKEHLEPTGPTYDVVIVRRVDVAAPHLKKIRRYCRNAKIIFDTVDLHFVREERRAALANLEKLRRQARRTKAAEYSAMQQTDATIVISDFERAVVQREWPDINVVTIPYIREIRGRQAGYASRQDIAFIGGFRHMPNVDAVLHFAHDIWPLVRSALPEVRFRIVGSHVTPDIEGLQTIAGIEVVGHVAELDPLFNRCRLTVAPLRFGAGIKGKIGTSLSYGVPCVASPIAAEGMQLTDQQDILVAATPADFAASIVKAYNDETLWQRLSDNGIAYMRALYSFERGVERYRALIDSIIPAQKSPLEYGDAPLISQGSLPG